MTTQPWAGSLEHRKLVEAAQRKASSDVHGDVATYFGVTRQQAKDANYLLMYGADAVPPRLDQEPVSPVDQICAVLASAGVAEKTINHVRPAIAKIVAR